MSTSSELAQRVAKKDTVAMGYLLANYLETDLVFLKVKFPHRYDNPEFVAKWRGDTKTIDDLPIGDTRISERMMARNRMDEARIKIIADSYDLVQYITDSFPPDEVETAIKTTNIPQYRTAATKSNWTATSYMFQGMSDFVVANRTILMANNTMPASFETQMMANGALFNAQYAIYGEANGSSKQTTVSIKLQIKDYYKRMQGIVSDLWHTFSTDKIKRESYTMVALRRAAVPGRKPSGIRFGLFNAVNSRAIVGAKVKMAYHDLETMSDKKGRVNFMNLPEGTFTLNVTAEGMSPITIANVLVKNGVMTTLKPFTMQPLPVDAPAPPTSEAPDSPMAEQKTTSEPLVNQPEAPAAVSAPVQAVDMEAYKSNGVLEVQKNGVH